LLLAVGLHAQTSPQTAPATTAQPPQPTFRASVDLVTTDVIVRDGRDQFVADLKAGEFDVFEDGVKQDIVSLVLTHGGRVYNVQQPPAPPAQEGIILPPSRPTNDAAWRVFLIFIDDLHLDFRSTPRTRELIKKMLRNLIHEGDMFGIVSTGTSSLSIQLTYDRQVLNDAIKRITGGGMKPSDMDVIESNEAFAVQAMAVGRDLELDPERVNPNGGAVALGHPIGATGTILTVKALHELQRAQKRLALVTMCIGGGQGIAAIFERV